MRTQSQARFIGQATVSRWQDRRLASATDMVMEAIAKERAQADAKPKLSLIQIFELALLCEVCLVIGFYIGWAVTNGN